MHHPRAMENIPFTHTSFTLESVTQKEIIHTQHPENCSPAHTLPCYALYLIPADPPDGSPSCSVEPALNHTSLRLLCSWPGGFPSPSLHWTGQLKQLGQNEVDTEQQTNPLTNTAILLPPEGLASNNSLFTCMGSHLALTQPTECSTRTCKKNKDKCVHCSPNLSHLTLHSPPPPQPDIPTTEPVCFAYVTNSKQYLMLSCSWDGAAPKALVWWEGPGEQGKGGQENSNILILRYGTARNGKPYTCYAKHPLLVQTKTCRLTLGQFTLSATLLCFITGDMVYSLMFVFTCHL